jgi:hypothetical protein
LFDAVPGHVHPVPAIETSVSPVGTVSVTVTVPLVIPALGWLDTVTVYTAFDCPRVKLPLWVFAILSADAVPALTIQVPNATGFVAPLAFETRAVTRWAPANAGKKLI